MTYTLHDDSRVVARIERDLARVHEAIQAADPHLRSLVLTGGFARGEGATLDGQPQNDYDLVAFRTLRPPRTPYHALEQRLQADLGLPVDIAPVATLRIPFLSPTIFWYETALRGRVLWGAELLHRIPVRALSDIDRREPLRLLANRAAGLLLATDKPDPSSLRLQAAKGLLAAIDTHLFAAGVFPPTQRDRWRAFGTLPEMRHAMPSPLRAWAAWGFHYKTDPGHAEAMDPAEAWQAAAQAIIQVLPTALRHAGLPSLEAYAATDTWLDALYYYRHSANIPGARRWVRHPAGRVRAATLSWLRAAVGQGPRAPPTALRLLRKLAPNRGAPLQTLEALRRATRQ